MSPIETRAGPLHALRVIEMDCPGPCQFAGMLLADLGATVLRIARPRGQGGPEWVPPEYEFMSRGRAALHLDLRRPQAVADVLALCRSAEVLLEGFRPGVMERLGLGPERCLEVNPRILYGRATGWGQEGPLARRAGHDINYIALTGALHAMRPAGSAPVPPLNLLGDFGGGGMLLVVGVLAGLLECRRSGAGQVIDAAIVDGTSLMMTLFHGLHAAGKWGNPPGENLFDGGAPMYAVYETSDGEHVAVGALEPKFYREFLEKIGLEPSGLTGDYSPEAWAAAKRRIADAIRSRTRAEWDEIFAGSDACATPILALGEAPGNPHLRARSSFVSVGGRLQPAPAPRFGRTPTATPRAERDIDVRETLRAFGIDEQSTARLLAPGRSG